MHYPACGLFYGRLEAATSGLFYFVEMKENRLMKEKNQIQRKKGSKRKGVTLFCQ